MLRIALCDDEADKLRETAALVQRYFQARPSVSGQVEAFQSGGELIARVQEPRGFDIYILDILMPGLSGIDAARKLRQLATGARSSTHQLQRLRCRQLRGAGVFLPAQAG